MARIPRLLVLATIVSLLSAGCGSAGPEGPLADGREVYGNICSACHGASGQGGIGPAFAGVLDTFASCEDHQRWISLGSDGWKSDVGTTYGDMDKEVAGGMPGHAERLTPEEIAAVAAFERSQYGGLDPDVALVQCGFDDIP